MLRRCVPEEEQTDILKFCHEMQCGGHFAGKKIAQKVPQSGFYWLSLFKDVNFHAKSCDRCQRVGSISKRDEMPLTNNLEVEVFDVWGIDFIGPFPVSFGKSYILVGVDYVSKWIEAVATKTCDAQVVLKFLKENVFSRFGTPKDIISDGGSHFCNKMFDSLLKKYNIHHKVVIELYFT